MQIDKHSTQEIRKREQQNKRKENVRMKLITIQKMDEFKNY